MAARTKLTPKKKRQFLEVLSKTANVTRAVETIGMARGYLYELREKRPKFAKDWDAAVELGTKSLEDEAARRASEGWDEPVFYQGEQTGMIRKFSDTLLIFLLKARDPKKYREKVDLNVGGQPNNPVSVLTAECTVEQATAIYRDILG